jgi:hypothetical protein
MSGDDNDRHDQPALLQNRGRLWGGSEALDGRDPRVTDNYPISYNEGHDGAIVVRGVDLWHVYHPEHRIPMLYFMCICPDDVPVCWDKVLQQLWCHRH